MDTQKKILILDDEDIIRDSLAIFFEDYGFQVFVASYVDSAIELIKENPVDAAIIDIRLPGKNGTELMKYIDEKNLNIICLVHTGSVGFELPEKLLHKKNISCDIFYKPVPELEVIKDRILEMLKENEQ